MSFHVMSCPHVTSHHVTSYHVESRRTVTRPTCQLTSSNRNQFKLSMTVFVGCLEVCYGFFSSCLHKWEPKLKPRMHNFYKTIICHGGPRNFQSLGNYKLAQLIFWTGYGYCHAIISCNTDYIWMWCLGHFLSPLLVGKKKLLFWD